MSTIVLRQTKGSALTFAEGDANFTNLNNDKLENITQESIGDLSDVDLTGNADGYVLVYNATSGKFEVEAQPAAGISNVVEDTTPQLGGNLDVQTNTITTSTVNGDIVIAPNGTGGIDMSGAEVFNLALVEYKEPVYTGGATTGTITPDVANGNVQSITLSGNITFNGFANAAAGQSMTLIILQPATGGPYTLTSTMLFAGGNKTLTATNDATDILTVFYDGTDYYASLANDFI